MKANCIEVTDLMELKALTYSGTADKEAFLLFGTTVYSGSRCRLMFETLSAKIYLRDGMKTICFVCWHIIVR